MIFYIVEKVELNCIYYCMDLFKLQIYKVICDILEILVIRGLDIFVYFLRI